MRVHTFAATAATLCFVTTNCIAQPYSTSMAQCGGLMSAMKSNMTDPDKADRLQFASNAWLTAAKAQAESEGVTDAEEAVLSAFKSMHDEWAAKGLRMALGSEFKDWAAYCGKFAKAQGIETGL